MCWRHCLMLDIDPAEKRVGQSHCRKVTAICHRQEVEEFSTNESYLYPSWKMALELPDIASAPPLYDLQIYINSWLFMNTRVIQRQESPQIPIRTTLFWRSKQRKHTVKLKWIIAFVPSVLHTFAKTISPPASRNTAFVLIFHPKTPYKQKKPAVQVGSITQAQKKKTLVFDQHKFSFSTGYTEEFLCNYLDYLWPALSSLLSWICFKQVVKFR